MVDGKLKMYHLHTHEFYLGTCTCVFKKIKPRGVGVDVEYGGCEGVRDVST